MAKGDTSTAGSKDSSTAPKMDQYSVMHGIMDKIGGMAGSIAPSVMPNRDMKTSADFANINPNGPPNSNNFGFSNPTINYGAQPDNQMGGRMQPMGMPRMGSMYGTTAGVPSIAPSNPQDMMRRTMMNKGVFNQGNASNPMI